MCGVPGTPCFWGRDGLSGELFDGRGFDLPAGFNPEDVVVGDFDPGGVIGGGGNLVGDDDGAEAGVFDGVGAVAGKEGFFAGFLDAFVEAVVERGADAGCEELAFGDGDVEQGGEGFEAGAGEVFLKGLEGSGEYGGVLVGVEVHVEGVLLGEVGEQDVEDDVGGGVALEVAAEVIGQVGDQGIGEFLDAGWISGEGSVLGVDPVAVAEGLEICGGDVAGGCALDVGNHGAGRDIGKQIEQVVGAVGASGVLADQGAALLEPADSQAIVALRIDRVKLTLEVGHDSMSKRIIATQITENV